MNKLTHGATRLLVLALGLGLASTVWATDYTFSNVDSDSLASWSDPSYGTQTFQFKLNAPSAKLAVGNFPSSGYVQLTSISLSARSDQSSHKTATKAILTNDKTSESYTATVAYNENAFSASMNPSLISDSMRREWTRMEVLMTFSTDGVLVDTDATYTLTFKNASDANVTMGYSVVKNDSLSIGWTPAMRIYGRTPSGSMEMPSSLIPSTGGITLPSTVIVADATDIAFASDSVTVGNGGISVSTSTRPVTVMMKVDNVPSTQSILTAVVLANARGMSLTRTATGFQQGESNNGSLNTNNGSGWGAASTTTVAAGAHWITLTYDQTANGTHSYMDGSSVACSTEANGLRYSGSAVTTVALGGPTATVANYPAAVGMVIKDVQIYSTELTTAQVATVTAALNKGWTVNASGTTITSVTLRELPNHANVQAIGSLAIAADGTYTASGLTEVKVLAGGSFDIGTARPTISGVASTGSLAVAPTGTVSQQIEGYVATEYLTVTGDLDGTVTLGGNTVTPVVADGTATLTSTLSANPTYTGESWWWDYEFNGTVVSIGSDKGDMTTESSSAVYYNSTELYFQQTPWRDAVFNDKSELTAVMYCAPGNYANTVLVGFGSTTKNDKKAIALVTGANPAAGEMKLVLAEGTTVTSLADLTAVGATTTKHLYAFVMDRVTENETTKTRIRVYLDGKVKAIYKHNGTLTLSNGFQIGSLHGGVVGGLTKYSSTGDSGTLDFLRVINGTLTDAAMANLAAAYPYNSAYGKATRAPVSSAANWVATDVWTQIVPGQADATQDAPNQDTNVTLSKDGSSDVSVAINLQSDSNYESLTLTKEAGATGSLKLTSGLGNGTSGKLITAETSVLVDTTVPAGRVHLGVTSIADGTTVTIDPVTTVISDAMSSLGFGEVYEDVVISMALLGNGASVELDPTGVSTLAGYGFTAELVYNSSNMSYTFKLTREEATADIEVTIASDGTATWATRSIAVPAPASLPSTYAGTVTITSAAENPVAIATAFAGGNVTVASGGPVTLSGAITTSGNLTLNGATTLSGTSTISGTVSGSATLTVDSSVTVASTGSIANTIAGDGTLTFEALPASALSFGEWTGTVVLPNVNGTEGGFRFDYYGKAGSTIKIENGFSGWLNTAEDARQVKANLIVNSAFTISGTNSGTWYNFAKMSGTGNFSLIQSNAPSGFHILVLEDYSGTLSNTIGSGTPTALTVSRLNLASAPVAGQKLVNTTTPNAVNLEAVYVGDAVQSVTLAKGSDGIYAALVSVTKGDNPTTYYATVSDAMTAAGSDAATITLLGNTDSNVSLAVGQSLVTGGFSVGTVSTSAANHHVENNDGVYTVALDQFAVTIPSVDHTTVSVSYTSGGEALVATAAGDITVDYGTDVTAAWTAVSGYKITSGASQTLNAVASAQTLASPTVEAMGATVSDVNFSYGADYATATVTATVSGDATSATLSYGGATYNANVGAGGAVTFENVAVTRGNDIYAPASYTITAKDGETAVTTTGGSGTSVAADVVAAGWINENATTHGLAEAGGAWTNAEAVSYSEGKAAISDNRFAATTASTASRVVLEFEVCFSSTSADDVSGEAQAAIKLGAVNDATTFMVLTTGNTWTPVSNAELPIDASATYDVVLTIDYGTSTYKVDVEGKSLTNSAGVASFPLATSKAHVQNIDFAGSGTLTSMKGDQLEGYMVKDALNHFYATIEAATQAYNSANGPYTVLHDGTAPSGWKIDNATKKLIKIAKGLFFMAY